MARQPRNFVSGIPVHLIQRGNNRSACFFQPRDYRTYLEKLQQCSRQFDVSIHNYVLMTNHVHLLVTPESAFGISLMMHSLGTYYVHYVNRHYERTGTLWEGRYKDCLIDTDSYFLTVSRYIELNPVRAGICQNPAQYLWSSFRRLAAGTPDNLVRPHPLYVALGATDRDRQARYAGLFQGEIPETTLRSIRDGCNKSCVLGDSQFKQRIEGQLGRALPPFQVGRPKSKSKNIEEQT